MKITECNPIPWRQTAELCVGPLGLPPLVYDGRLADCVYSVSGKVLSNEKPPGGFEIYVRGYERIELDEIRRLARMLPLEIEPRKLTTEDIDYQRYEHPNLGLMGNGRVI